MLNFYFNSKNWALKGKAMWPTCYKCFARRYSHPNSPCLASSRVAFGQRQTRGSGLFITDEQLTKKQLLHNFSS